MAKQAPAGLGLKAKKVWKEITEGYDLRADEAVMLENACREIDTIERMEKEIAALPSLTVEGSMGQPVISELVKDIRQHRNTLKAMFASLKLEDDSAPKSRSSTARDAANARWRVRGAS